MDVLGESDLSIQVLRSRLIGIIGFGSQGRAQALNLRDSGLSVVVGLRPGSDSWQAANAAGLAVCDLATAARRADLLMLLIPDEVQPEVYEREIRPHFRAGGYLGFAHGFAVHFGLLRPSADTNVFLVAPKGIGPMVRRQYQAGFGVPALVAVHQDPSGDTRQVALAYAGGLGCGRAGILETSFGQETETDLFGEQAVLCGGLSELIRAGFQTLVEAGYPAELAYFECLHEVKLIADLIQERGIAGMRRAISSTAAYGDLTRGPRIIGPATRQAMRQVLAEIRSGLFARQWMAEHAAGKPTLRSQVARDDAELLEQVGRRLRALAGPPTASPAASGRSQESKLSGERESQPGSSSR